MVNHEEETKVQEDSIQPEVADAVGEEPVSKTENKKMDEADIAKLYEESLERLKEDEIVKGTIIQITKDYALVDVGGKSEGQISIGEFTNEDGQVEIKPGDEVDVYIEKSENENGLVVLSKEKADQFILWEEIRKACEEDEIVEGKIVSKIKGGMVVDIGVKAFLPGSQIDLHPVKDLDRLIGQVFRFKIVKFNRRRGNIVLSRRALLEQ